MTSNTRREITDDEFAILRGAGYSDRSIEYFLDQVNLGKIEDPDIKHIEIGECGDLMFLFINLGEGVVIDEITFRYAGCPALAASGSSMTQLAKGRTIYKASDLSVEDLMRDLGSLPEDHMHCPVLAIKTLKGALDPYLEKKILNLMEHDNYVHFCGLTGMELEAQSSVLCGKCHEIKRCEDDHIIIMHTQKG